jgi:hypothetical protein
VPRVVEAVFVEEERADGRLLGTFATRLGRGPRQTGGNTLAEAIAWGSERTGIVLVRFGRRTGWWSAGPTPHWSYPPWPPPDAPALVPRPEPPDDWRANGVAGGLEWAVTLWLSPDGLSASVAWEQREQWRVAVAGAASDCRARWDADSIDRFLADAREPSFFTMHAPAFRVYLVIEAETEREATETGAAACVPPPGFSFHWSARPADLDDRV